LLVVDRDPWQLELYRHDGDSLRRVATSQIGEGVWLESQVLGLRFRLQSGTDRPRIEVQHAATGKSWRI
jgi:hypothetical protein